jgi:hypothetical protein
MTVLTLERYTPLEREDGFPWTAARIQEAAAPTGTWAQIDQITLTPLDSDPANPATRDLTTTHATLTEGWYRVIWVDGSGATSSPTPPVQNLSDLAGGTRPSVAEVAALLRARTKIAGGKEVGTFNTQTRPTGSEVEVLIDQAVDEIEGKVQPVDTTVPAWTQQGDTYNASGSPYERRIRRAITLYAAILIELSYFPEQVRNDQSPVAVYQQLYDERIRALITEGEVGRPGGMGEGTSGAGDAPADAYWSFPDAAPGALVGWASRW